MILLLGGLDYLGHQLSKAPMVSQNCETVAQEVLSPLAHGDSDGVQLLDVGGGLMDAWAKCLAKERNWVALLDEENSHGDA